MPNQEVKAEQIQDISIDLSPAFISGAMTYLPEAKIIFDRFHVAKLLNKAMDTIKKIERKEHDLLKGHKYTFLIRFDALSEAQEESLIDLIRLHPLLGEAYRLKVLLDTFWNRWIRTISAQPLYVTDNT